MADCWVCVFCFFGDCVVDVLVYGVGDEHVVYGYGLGLSYSVDSGCCLSVLGWCPRWFDYEHVCGCG